MKHCGTQPIETPRLLLRAFMDEDDNDMLKNWIANPNVQFEYGEPIYTTTQEVKSLLDEWKKVICKLIFTDGQLLKRNLRRILDKSLFAVFIPTVILPR